MGQVERGAIKAPNMPDKAGDMRNNGFLPLGGGAATIHPANVQGPGGDRRGGSFPLGGGAPAIQDRQLRFTPSDVPGCHGYQTTSTEPGKGDIPVIPTGLDATRMAVSDEAKSRGR